MIWLDGHFLCVICKGTCMLLFLQTLENSQGLLGFCIPWAIRKVKYLITRTFQNSCYKTEPCVWHNSSDMFSDSLVQLHGFFKEVSEYYCFVFFYLMPKLLLEKWKYSSFQSISQLFTLCYAENSFNHHFLLNMHLRSASIPMMVNQLNENRSVKSDIWLRCWKENQNPQFWRCIGIIWWFSSFFQAPAMVTPADGIMAIDCSPTAFKLILFLVLKELQGAKWRWRPMSSA